MLSLFLLVALDKRVLNANVNVGDVSSLSVWSYLVLGSNAISVVLDKDVCDS